MTDVKLLAATLVLVATACGGKANPNHAGAAETHGDPCGGDPCGGDAAAGWSAWGGWTKINATAFVSEGHRDTYVDVFVPATFVDAYRDRSAPAPVGMRVVKAQYSKTAADVVSGLTVMMKMEPGYDPEHGDWLYGVYDPAGTKAKMEGKLEMCIECHENDADRDYLVGVPTP